MSHTVGDRHIRQRDEFLAIISRRVGPELMINEYYRGVLQSISVVQGPRNRSGTPLKGESFFFAVAEFMCVWLTLMLNENSFLGVCEGTVFYEPKYR